MSYLSEARVSPHQDGGDIQTFRNGSDFAHVMDTIGRKSLDLSF